MSNIIEAFAQLARYFRAARGLGYCCQPAYEEHCIAALHAAGIEPAPFYSMLRLRDPRYDISRYAQPGGH